MRKYHEPLEHARLHQRLNRPGRVQLHTRADQPHHLQPRLAERGDGPSVGLVDLGVWGYVEQRPQTEEYLSGVAELAVGVGVAVLLLVIASHQLDLGEC